MQTQEENIRIRAHQLWDNDGRPHGRHLDYWLRAEQELSIPSNQGPVNEGLVSGGEARQEGASSTNGGAKTRAAKSNGNTANTHDDAPVGKPAAKAKRK